MSLDPWWPFLSHDRLSSLCVLLVNFTNNAWLLCSDISTSICLQFAYSDMFDKFISMTGFEVRGILWLKLYDRDMLFCNCWASAYVSVEHWQRSRAFQAISNEVKTDTLSQNMCRWGQNQNTYARLGGAPQLAWSYLWKNTRIHVWTVSRHPRWKCKKHKQNLTCAEILYCTWQPLRCKNKFC